MKSALQHRTSAGELGRTLVRATGSKVQSPLNPTHCAHGSSSVPMNTGRSRFQGSLSVRCSNRDGIHTALLKHFTGTSRTNLAAHPNMTSTHTRVQRSPQPTDWKQPAISMLTAISFLAQTLGPVSPVQAKALFTPEENLTISIFKKNTPSVVNITNLASK